MEAIPGIAPEVAERLLAEGRRIALKAGDIAFRPGDVCAHFLILLGGSIGVRLVSETGHEILLYRVAAGETCILTTACLLSQDIYAAEGVAESDATALALDTGSFDALMAGSKAFRSFVLQGFGARIADLMARIDAVAFHRIDERLAGWLLARPAQAIQATHQDIAVELGTAREVVSRRLKAFEKQGLLRIGRASVEVVDRAGLTRLAEGVT